MSVLDPTSETGQQIGTEIEPPHQTDLDLGAYLGLSEDSRAQIHQNDELKSALWNSLSQNPSYTGMGPNEKMKMLAMFGFPLNRLDIPPVSAMPPMDFGGQIPMAPPAPGQVPMAPPQAPQGPQASPSWAEFLFGAARPTKVTWPTDEPPQTGFGQMYQAVMNTYARQPGNEMYGMQGVIDAPMAAARGILASVTPKSWQPPEYQPGMLSIDKAAEVLAMYYVTSKIPVLSAIPRFGGAVVGQAAGLAGQGAAAVTEAFLPSITQFLVKNPGITRRAMAGLVEGGRYASLEILRDGIAGGLKDGEWTTDELAKTWGPSLLWNVGLGAGIGAATGAIPAMTTSIRGTARSLRGTTTQAALTKSVSQAVDDGGLKALQAQADALATVPNYPPTMPGEAMPPMQGPPELGAPLGALPVKTPPSPQAVAAQTAQAAAADVDTALTLTKTVVSPVDGSMTATVPKALVSKNFPTPQTAQRGDYVYLEGKNRVAMVLDRGENGLQVQEVGGGSYALPFESKRIKSIQGMRGPFGPGDEVADTAGQYVVDRFVPNGKVVVIGPDGRPILKDPATLMTQKGQQTAKLLQENADAGIAGPVPEGGAVYQEFDVVAEGTKPKPHPLEGGYFVPGAFVALPKAGMSFVRRVIGSEDVAIPGRVATSPSGIKMGTWEYWKEPWTVLVQYGDQQLRTVAKTLFDSAKTANTLKNEFLAQHNTWRNMVDITTESSARLMRAVTGLSSVADQAAMTLPEKHVVQEFKAFGQKYLLPLVNKDRALMGQPLVSDVFDLPMLLAPETVLGGGSRFLIGGDDVRLLGSQLTRTGVGQGVTRTTATGTQDLTLHLTGNFWDLSKRMMGYAATQTAFGDAVDLTKNAARYARGQLGSERMGQYLDWLSQAYTGRTGSPMLFETLGHASWLQKVEQALGAKSSAKLYDITGQTLVEPLQAARFNLTHADMFEVAQGIKSLSYMATLGLSMRTALVNMTQPITHIAPSLPGRGAEAAAANLMAVGEGYVRGAGAALATAGGDIASLAARRLPERMKPFWESTARLFDTKALQEYKRRGIIGDLEDVFTSSAGNEGRMQALKDGTKALFFFNMRYSEILNRVAGAKMLERSYREDMKRKGLGAILDRPDMKFARDELVEMTTNAGNFLYGSGFKSRLHEGGQWGPLTELAAQFQTFAYKTASLMSLEMQQLTKNSPNAIRQMVGDTAPREFADYLQTLRPEERYQIFRTALIRSVAAGAMGAITLSASIAANMSPLGMLPNPFSVAPVIKHPVMAGYYGWEEKNRTKALKELQKIVWPAALDKWVKGTTLWQKTIGSPSERSQRPPTFWQTQGLAPAYERR